MFSNISALLLRILAGFLAENVVSHNLATFYIYAQIRLIQISAEIFVQPAEFSKKRKFGLGVYSMHKCRITALIMHKSAALKSLTVYELYLF